MLSTNLAYCKDRADNYDNQLGFVVSVRNPDMSNRAIRIVAEVDGGRGFVIAPIRIPVAQTCHWQFPYAMSMQSSLNHLMFSRHSSFFDKNAVHHQGRMTMKPITTILILIGLAANAASAADIKKTKQQENLIVKTPAVKVERVQLDSTINGKKWLVENHDKLGELKNIDADRKEQARLPDRQVTDPAKGSGLAGRGQIERDETNVGSLVRDLFRLREGGYETAKIGRTNDNTNPLHQEDSTAAGAKGAPSNPGHSADGWTSRQCNRTDSSASFKGNYVDSQGRQHRMIAETYANEDGSSTRRSTLTTLDATGTQVLSSGSRETVRDADGNLISQRIERSADTEKYVEAVNAFTAEVDRVQGDPNQGSQGAPNDNDVNRAANPCSPTSNFGCGSYKVSYMDKISGPVHGEDVKTLSGTGGKPNAGPSSVTNPGTHDGSSAGGRNVGGGKPGEHAVDPEEIIPPIGGKFGVN